AYTVEAWINVAAGTNNAAIIVQDRGAGTGHSLTFGLDGNGACALGSCFRAGTGKLMFGDDSNNLFVGVESPIALNDGAWHHVAGSWSATAGTAVSSSQFSLYVDGAKVVSPVSLSIGNDNSPLSGSGGQLLGFHQSWNVFFRGSMDEVRISNTVRSSDWIATAYTNQSNPAAFLT